MGREKSRLLVDGEPVAERTARELGRFCERVTILGREKLSGHHFLADQDEFAGPLVALSRFKPTADMVFVASCDLPLFDGETVHLLHSLATAGSDAVVPEIGSHLQPLCALYSPDSWTHISLEGEKKSLMSWLRSLKVRVVGEQEFVSAGISLKSLQSANTPNEWATLMNLRN